MRNSIGGPADYRLLPGLFRPSDDEALARAARRLADVGLHAGDIALVLKVEPAQVQGWLKKVQS